MAQFEKIETTIYVVFVPIRVLSEFLQTKQFIIPKGDSFARRHFQFNCSLSLSLSLHDQIKVIFCIRALKCVSPYDRKCPIQTEFIIWTVPNLQMEQIDIEIFISALLIFFSIWGTLGLHFLSFSLNACAHF